MRTMQSSLYLLATTALLVSGSDVGLRRLASNEKSDKNFVFTMAKCPGKCLATIGDTSPAIELDECSDTGDDKYWDVLYNCGGEGDSSFFKIRHVATQLCISDPDDCAICDEEIRLVDCETNRAGWFSYGNLHKTSPKAHSLYSARCWLKEGRVAVLSTPSLEAKTCPQDQSTGACQRVEWNLDHFSNDVLYYEWSFNSVNSQCSTTLGLF